MTARKIGKNKWLTYGTNDGFNLGFSISRFYVVIEFGFWYVGFEF